MPKNFPILGTIYNVVSLGSIPVLIGGVIAGNETIMYAGIAMMVPTTFLPETKAYRDYWKRFRGFE